MFRLIDIKKTYGEGENKVDALKGISLDFKNNGLVSICGQSGCGKTTLLNIIGGLDRYSSGDLVINGTSTKNYSVSDWDSYRNHHVGFVFQNYYLIPQLTVLENVMLAMDISGVGYEEKKKRAIEALEKVGLGDQLKKKPKHLSGGQAQRVAIARAICNDPTIILADEPTGALDSKNSVQILELLKSLSKESLVIIVTHNNELAQAYSDRIINVKDGEVVSDEYLTPQSEEKQETIRSFKKKTHISFGASFVISLKNLYYKKGRTLITSFAGCIGVIAISIILAFNAGFSSYALSFQKSQLSKYPIYVKRTQSSFSDINDIVSRMDGDNYSTLDTNTILDILTDETSVRDTYTEEDAVYIQKLITGIVASFDNLAKENDTTKLTEYVDARREELDEFCVIKKDYDVMLNVYKEDDGIGDEKQTDGKYMMLSPFSDRVIEGLTSSTMDILINSIFNGSLRDKEKNDIVNAFGQVTFWDSLIEDQKILSSQYDLLEGRWPSAEKEDEGIYEMVLVVDKYNQITDADLYALGKIGMVDLLFGIIHNSGDGLERMLDTMAENKYKKSGLRQLLEYFNDIPTEYSFSDFVYNEEEGTGDEYRLLTSVDYYVPDEGGYRYVGDDKEAIENIIENNSVRLRISGIVRQKEDVSSGCINGVIGYPQSLVKYIIQKISSSDLVREQVEAYKEYLAVTESEEYQTYIELLTDIANQKRTLSEQPLTQKEVLMMLKYATYGIDEIMVGDNVEEIVDSIVGTGSEEYRTYVEFLVNIINNNRNLIEQPPTQTEILLLVKYATCGIENKIVGDKEEKIIDVIEYEALLNNLGVKQLEVPEAIYFYPFSIEGSEKVVDFLNTYNNKMKQAYEKGEAEKDESVEYVNELKDIMNSLSGMINTITFILIAVTCLSVLVSAIMVAIIMYISVQDRTKEIGILRSMGARRMDIMNIFNAETILLGLFSGLIGILIGYVLTYPLNIVLKQKLFISNLLTPLWWHSIILLAASVVLTCISGFIPAIIAAHRDPVKSLKTE